MQVAFSSTTGRADSVNGAPSGSAPSGHRRVSTPRSRGKSSAKSKLTSLGLDLDDVSRAAWWVEDGRRDGGHRAVARSLIAAGGVWGVVGRFLLVPPLCWFAAIGYRIVADNRGRLPGHAPSCRT